MLRAPCNTAAFHFNSRNLIYAVFHQRQVARRLLDSNSIFTHRRTLTMAPEDSAARLDRLRGLMKEHNLDA
jgi:hypothetical protein